MIDIFSPLGEASAPVQNWTGIPEPPFWKELTGGMSWPPSGAFPPSPPPACAYNPAWPCKPWPPPPPPGWPTNWPWPLPLGPAAGAPPPPPPGAVAPPAKPEEKQTPWGWIILGGLALGAGLLVMTSAGVLALADNPRGIDRRKRAAQLLIDQDDGSVWLARMEAARRAAWARGKGDARTQSFWEEVERELEARL